MGLKKSLNAERNSAKIGEHRLPDGIEGVITDTQLLSSKRIADRIDFISVGNFSGIYGDDPAPVFCRDPRYRKNEGIIRV